MTVFQKIIPDDSVMPVIMGMDGASYGRELSMAISDGLDDATTQLITSLATTNKLPHVLDIGGASGHRASQFAAMGAEVLVLDICDNRNHIDTRNKVRGNAAPIAFVQMDAKTLDDKILCREEWSLINVRRVLHWLSRKEAENLLASLPHTMSNHTHISLCFQHAGSAATDTVQHHKSAHNFFYKHRPVDILDYMKQCGYDILAHGAQLSSSHGNYTIFARLPNFGTPPSNG